MSCPRLYNVSVKSLTVRLYNPEKLKVKIAGEYNGENAKELSKKTHTRK